MFLEQIMNTPRQTDHVTRDELLKRLSEDEVASVRIAETTAWLAKGDEYLDLAHLDKGVRRSPGKTTKTWRVLPKIALHHKTWNKIMAQLAAPLVGGAPASP